MAYTQKESGVRCLECGDPITYGRQDKKFCCANCKNRYHNRRDGKVRHYRLKVVRILDVNHQILERLYRHGRCSASWEELRDLGYVQGYATACSKRGPRQEYRCFDLVYDASENKIFHLRQLPGF